MSIKKLSIYGLVSILLLVSIPVSTTSPHKGFFIDDTDGSDLQIHNFNGNIEGNDTEEPDNQIIPDCGQLNWFSSYEEFTEFVTGNSYPSYDTLTAYLYSGSTSSVAFATSGSSQMLDYSSTNIQVKGVDEPDVVKTDGEYLYTISERNVTIVKAYPPDEARLLARINSNDKPEGMFVNADRLVVFERSFKKSYKEIWGSHIKTYDISSRSNPVLIQNISITGNYLNSRMINNKVYVIFEDHIRFQNGSLILPMIEKDNMLSGIKPTEIGYFNGSTSLSRFTIILSINLEDSEDFEYKVYFMDTSKRMYVSPKSIYLTNGYYYSNTNIHKISIADGDISYICSCEVPGRLLNQFSMSEYEGFLRVATSIGIVSAFNNESRTNVYVLDELLNFIGKLEGIAPGEQMYSARFMGNRVYLVTFKKVDPFFVIDLSLPSEPKILGELKITGYSNYLHPYDENHIIGLGKETVEAETGNFAWYQGVKLSLFDVTDVGNPIEISKYIIGDRGTSSSALYDHKAFLFSKSKNLLIIPIRLALINESNYLGDIPPYAFGEYVWQGAYVFTLTLENGFDLKGRITHFDESTYGGRYFCYYYYHTPGYCVKRSLYIDEYIYTISEELVKINRMDNLDEVNKIELKGEIITIYITGIDEQVTKDATDIGILLPSGKISTPVSNETPGFVKIITGSQFFTPRFTIFF